MKVETYTPKHVEMKAMKFSATEEGIYAAQMWVGSDFRITVAGFKNLAEDGFEINTSQGFVPLNDGDYICKGEFDFYPNAEKSFEKRWEKKNA